MSGVKYSSKVVLLENHASRERKLEEMKKCREIAKASEAFAQVRAEVDKLSERVDALEVAVIGGAKVEAKEFDLLTKLLMRQLLKLDGIKAEGEAKLQRKAEAGGTSSFGYQISLWVFKTHNCSSLPGLLDSKLSSWEKPQLHLLSHILIMQLSLYRIKLRGFTCVVLYFLNYFHNSLFSKPSAHSCLLGFDGPLSKF